MGSRHATAVAAIFVSFFTIAFNSPQPADTGDYLCSARSPASYPKRLPLWLYNFYTEMRFEFDPWKSAANASKHGIDFDAARALWDDPDRLEIPARSQDEPRFQVIGRIGERIWSAFITYRRHPNETIRIISVRRARAEEEERHLAG